MDIEYPCIAFALCILFIAVMQGTSGRGDAPGIGLALLVLVLYAVMALIYLVMGRYLWRFGSASGRLSLYRRSSDLEEALAAQKSFWRLIGIAILVIIGLYIAALAFVMVGAAFL